MKTRMSLIFYVLFSAFLTMGLLGATPAQSQTTWKIQSFVSKSDCDWYVTLTRVKEMIEKASDGEVKVDIFPAGTLVAPDSIVDAVTNGAIQGGHILAGMAADRVPSALGTEMPYGVMSTKEHQDLHFRAGLIDIMREEYDQRNLFLLTAGTSGQLVFQSTFPVNSVADFEGKKIWAIPNALWLTKFGAATVEVPGMDMYSATKLGTIDGFTWTAGELEFANFKEVVKYVMVPRILTPGAHVILNKRAWNKLDKGVQQKILTHIAVNQIHVAEEYDSYDEKSLKAARDYGVKFIELPPEEIAKLKAAAQDFWKEVEGLSPHAAKMVALYKEYMKSKGIR